MIFFARKIFRIFLKVGIFLFYCMNKNFLKSCHKFSTRAYNEVKTKIFENEVLDDEKLEKVSGGSWENIVDDANRFKRDFGIDFASQYYQMVVNFDDVDYFVRQDLIRTFEKCGVRMEFHNEAANKYFIGDKEVTREAAFNQVKNKLGK